MGPRSISDNFETLHSGHCILRHAYILMAYWEKPYDIQVPVTLSVTNDVPEEDDVDRVIYDF
jgi:hypothetical protein